MYQPHHICNTYLRFPPEDQLQFALKNHRALSDPWLQENKIHEIFASNFAKRERSPSVIRPNVRLVVDSYDEIPKEKKKNLLNLFTKVLIEIARKYTREQPVFS